MWGTVAEAVVLFSLCGGHWLIGYDSHSIFLAAGEVGAQRGSVPPNGSPTWRNRVPKDILGKMR